MTLINGSFEDGWYTRVDKNQEPNGWALDYPAVGSLLLAPELGDGDTQNKTLCIPECVHKLSEQLPADEQLGGEDALILDGSTTYKIFGNSAFRATLEQTFTVDKGAKCRLVTPVQVHGHLNPDTGQPYNIDTGAAYWRVTINGYPGKWYTFNNDFHDRTWWQPEHLFTAVYGTVTILIEFECHTLGGVDFFIDYVQFSSEGDQPQPTNTIPDGGYDRTYWVVPDVYTDPERREYIYALAAVMQYTVGPSADDSRAWATELIDAGNTVTAVVWDVPEDKKDAWEDYYLSREPRMIIEFRGGDPTSPPVGGAPDPIEHYSGNFVGLHSALLKEGWDTYAVNAKPNLMKVFSCGDAVRAKAMQPNMLTIWRHHVGNDGGYLEGDIKADALKVLDMYSAEIKTHGDNAWMTELDVLKYVDVLESINETYPSFNTDHLLRAIDFDMWFSEHLHNRYGDAVSAGVFTAAVGNPFEGEFPLLLPLAEQAMQMGDYFGYHSYWSADEIYSYLIPHWQWHAGRWQEMDRVFVDNGVYVKWYFGEAGICYTTPESGGWSFVPSEGWKACGSFSDYINDIEMFNNMIIDWNSTHQGRCYGGTLFCYGGWGWESFDAEPGDLLELGDLMETYA